LPLNALPGLFLKAFRGWRQDNAARLGAALAYYSLLTLTPLLIVLIAVAGLVLGREEAQARVVAELEDLVGSGGASALEQMIQSAHEPQLGTLATAAGIIALLVGATSVLVEIKGSLNTIWRTHPPRRPLLAILRDRVMALGMILTIGFFLLLSLLISAVLTAASDGFLAMVLPDPGPLVKFAHSVAALLVNALLFSIVFKVLPDTRIAWSDVWLGAIVTSLLFAAGKGLVGIYLGRSSITSIYGAAGSIVAIVIWVYYEAQVLFYGAELTRAYAQSYGSRRTMRARV
jgi:membrane protein